MLAARGAGLRRVMLPRAGERDLRDLAEEADGAIEFVFVGRTEDVPALAISDLQLKPEPVKAG